MCMLMVMAQRKQEAWAHSESGQRIPGSWAQTEWPGDVWALGWYIFLVQTPHPTRASLQEEQSRASAVQGPSQGPFWPRSKGHRPETSGQCMLSSAT